MNKLFTLFFFALIISGCEEPDPLPIDPSEPSCNLDVMVYYCSLFPCDDVVYLGNVEVRLFESEEDAISGFNVLESVSTDAGGQARFIAIDCGAVYVRVDSENNGTYISYQNLSLVSTLNFHEVRFVKNYFYDDDDSAGPIQTHISLEFPTVGMTSTYRYFHDAPLISFTPIDYDDNYLRVTIVDQVDEYSYVVQEELDFVTGSLNWPTSGSGETVVRNVWTITEDEVFVSPLQGDYFTSYIWGLTEWFVNTEKEGYSFSLVKPEEEVIDMETDEVAVMGGIFGALSIADFTLFGNRFEDLIGDRVSYISFDGPEKLRVYSKKDGPVRYINFWDGGSVTTKGFDLILE